MSPRSVKQETLAVHPHPPGIVYNERAKIGLWQIFLFLRTSEWAPNFRTPLAKRNDLNPFGFSSGGITHSRATCSAERQHWQCRIQTKKLLDRNFYWRVVAFIYELLPWRLEDRRGRFNIPLPVSLDSAFCNSCLQLFQQGIWKFQLTRVAQKQQKRVIWNVSSFALISCKINCTS